MYAADIALPYWARKYFFDSLAHRPWESLPDSQVKQAGFVRFDPSRDGGTRLSVQMEYLPPAGALGHAVAQLFGVDPRQALNDDLMRLKSLLETGKTSSSKGTAELGSEESME